MTNHHLTVLVVDRLVSTTVVVVEVVELVLHQTVVRVVEAAPQEDLHHTNSNMVVVVGEDRHHSELIVEVHSSKDAGIGMIDVRVIDEMVIDEKVIDETIEEVVSMTKVDGVVEEEDIGTTRTDAGSSRNQINIAKRTT